MPIILPIEVQVPPSYDAQIDFIQERVSQYAQALVDDAVANNRPHRKMTLAEVESNSISLEESERRVSNLIHDFYHKEEA